jgi:outer membrane lipoprotein-sorting protein
MTRLKILFISIAMLTFASISALSQTPPAQSSEQQSEAQALLQKVAEASRALKSYHFEGTQLIESKSEGTFNRTEMKFVWAGEQPNKYRLEKKTPSYNRMAMISDGQTLWNYQGRIKQFTKQAQMPGASSARQTAPIDQLGGARLTDRMLSAKLLGEETIRIGEKTMACQLVEVERRMPSYGATQLPPGRDTYWIDKERFLVVRKKSHYVTVTAPDEEKREMDSLITLDVFKVDEPLPAALFTFTPPEGVKEVKQFDFASSFSPRMTNLPAANFALKDLTGKTVDLETTRGKVVLLNFWSSW